MGGRFVGQSGTPKLKLASHPVYENTGEISLAPRGSLGETPFEYNIDMNFGKKFTLPTNFESSVRLDVDIFNVLGRTYPTNWDWDYDTALNLDTCTVAAADATCATPQQQLQRLIASVANGVPNPDYGKPTTYSAPREIRFSVKWQF